MAETENLAPTRRRSPRARVAKADAKVREQQLEEQIGQLQSDLKSIADTLSRLTGDKVTEAKSLAKTEVRQLQLQAEHVIDDVKEQAGALESQLKETIREKPLTAVASAIGIGFLLALLSRR